MRIIPIKFYLVLVNLSITTSITALTLAATATSIFANPANRMAEKGSDQDPIQQSQIDKNQTREVLTSAKPEPVETSTLLGLGRASQLLGQNPPVTQPKPSSEPDAKDPNPIKVPSSEIEEIEITVTGTRTPRSVLDSSGSITIIKREDLRLNQAFNLRDLLRYEPNLSVENSPRLGFRNFNIRGIQGNRVLLQVDGIRIPSQLEVITNTSRDYFDLSSIGRLEILKAPGSALYGSDALGGVVSVQTVDPSDLLNSVGKDIYFELTAGYNSVNSGFTGGITIAARQENIDFLLAYTRRDFNEPQRNGNAVFSDRQVGRSNNYLGKIVFHLDQFNTLKFTGEVFNLSSDTNIALANLRGETMSGLTTRFLSGFSTNRARLSANYEFNNPDAGFIQLAKVLLYYQESQSPETTIENRLATAASTTPTRLRLGQNNFLDKIFGLDLQLESNITGGEVNQKLTYGFDLSSQRNERSRDKVQFNTVTGVQFPRTTLIPDLFPTKDFPDSDTLRFGIFIQDEISLGGGAFSIIPGIRLDTYNLSTSPDADYFRNGAPPPANFSSTAITPRLGLVWRASPEISVFGQYARGNRVPRYDEINSGFANALFGYRVIPNPDLKAETSDGFELGVRGSFPQGKFSLVGFYNLYDNFIATNQLVRAPFVAPFTQTFQALNIQRARTYGLEASGEYRFSPEKHGFSLLGSLGFTVGDDLITNQPLTTVDPFKAVAGLRYRAPENQWGVDLLATFVGKASVATTSTLIIPEAYTTFDLIGFYNFTPAVTLNVGVFNLFNARYFQYADLRNSGLSSASANDLARIDRYAQPGINIAASLSWRF
jgi:hemoglobin/transferrin/lactoferrin receptor protein